MVIDAEKSERQRSQLEDGYLMPSCLLRVVSAARQNIPRLRYFARHAST